jgi:hypothetical protein
VFAKALTKLTATAGEKHCALQLASAENRGLAFTTGETPRRAMFRIRQASSFAFILHADQEASQLVWKPIASVDGTNAKCRRH